MATQVYSVVLASNVGGQFANNIFHYEFDDSGYATTSAAANALNTMFVGNYLTPIKTICPSATTFLSVKARRVTGSGGFEAISIINPGTVGLRSGNLMAAALSPCLIWYPVSNAKARGRTFLPGVSDSDVVDGFFQSAFKTAVSTQAAAIITPHTLSGGGAPTATPIIWHRGPPPTSHLPQAILLSDKLGTLRRRQVPS